VPQSVRGDETPSLLKHARVLSIACDERRERGRFVGVRAAEVKWLLRVGIAAVSLYVVVKKRPPRSE
jgi:hypothetical protein